MAGMATTKAEESRKTMNSAVDTVSAIIRYPIAPLFRTALPARDPHVERQGMEGLDFLWGAKLACLAVDWPFMRHWLRAGGDEGWALVNAGDIGDKIGKAGAPAVDLDRRFEPFRQRIEHLEVDHDRDVGLAETVANGEFTAGDGIIQGLARAGDLLAEACHPGLVRRRPAQFAEDHGGGLHDRIA